VVLSAFVWCGQPPSHRQASRVSASSLIALPSTEARRSRRRALKHDQHRQTGLVCPHRKRSPPDWLPRQLHRLPIRFNSGFLEKCLCNSLRADSGHVAQQWYEWTRFVLHRLSWPAQQYVLGSTVDTREVGMVDGVPQGERARKASDLAGLAAHPGGASAL
jgi:hypothetical protein